LINVEFKTIKKGGISSSCTFGPRRMKFDRNNPQSDGSKSSIFESLDSLHNFEVDFLSF